MAAPVAIGTRGTIGSLVRKEIEYFTKFELDIRGISQKPQQHLVDMEKAKKPSFWFLPTTWKKRKQRSSTNRFIRKICSVTEVDYESNQFNRIPGYSYKILRDDINNFHL
ncbi:hypothetical protein MtrunA17_Chr2g0288131 [Medicago truncatula]|uniref:Uncharacterized protein n=1 Tax=Medicago truncatula TaxID=3880 RepID=A0A072V492_MEDTR|nr:uncharacterized protein LOC25486127 [Medicago truncatula]KEH36824.1 hypothetical protein MTR_2g022820 [Medicago truncatula]RHN72481.1 hypothetical protein MtrunA17_Chr2g0288131 [Medicago truncatula]